VAAIDTHRRPSSWSSERPPLPSSFRRIRSRHALEASIARTGVPSSRAVPHRPTLDVSRSDPQERVLPSPRHRIVSLWTETTCGDQMTIVAPARQPHSAVAGAMHGGRSVDRRFRLARRRNRGG
jgi:hypothetical protein